MFSPNRLLELYTVDGLLQAERQRYAREERPYYSYASGFFAAWVQMSLVGLESEASDLARYALEWAQRSIDIKEDPFGSGIKVTRVSASQTRALAAWALGDPQEEAHWAVAAEAHASYYKPIEPELRPNDRNETQIRQLALWAHAGQAKRALAYWRARGGSADGRVNSSSSIKRTLIEYAAAKHDPALRTEALQHAGRRILRARLDTLFGSSGQYERGALWLALVYGGPGSSLSPAQVIRKAYENMPNTPWPDFLPSE